MPARTDCGLKAALRGLKPAPVHDWLFTPNLLLDDYRPVELLREGEPRRVLGAIDALAEAVFV